MSNESAVSEEFAEGLSTGRDQFLTFTLKDEEYGIDILRVQEIKGFSKIHAVPHSPSYIKGLMNLRGTVVPIVDLRTRFGMEAVEYNQFTVIIVVSLGTKLVGLIVDAVSDVLDVPHGQVEEAPDLGSAIDNEYFSGMTKVGEKLVFLLDIDTLVDGEKLEEVQAAA
ncbi:chemotaxis protein CheW [Blastopirellula marina]|uniref:Chemotaxis protein CheW n=1 Tax=Blastopirellula marina TaxID=124 RepID=A0A2S8G177_9BACT|nr:chemotaxis protein CheW [Blastopirellula marina]PQO38011.1 chemotaxis protein CheW [Blastopirellula marina]PTL44667.1 chemotaxis protein CheW [Blastopirellula marina]